MSQKAETGIDASASEQHSEAAESKIPVASQSEQACKKARTLKQQVSDVSLDSKGWPNILTSPRSAEKAKGSKQSEDQAMSILEKQRASFRSQLEKAAHSAADAYVKKCQEKGPEKRPESYKRPASQKKSQPCAFKKPAVKALEAATHTGPAKRPWTAVKKVLGKDLAYCIYQALLDRSGN